MQIKCFRLILGFVFCSLPVFALAAVFTCDNEWNVIATGSSENFKTLKWDGNAYKALANSETPQYISTDGIHWGKQTVSDQTLGVGPGGLVQSKTASMNQESSFLLGAVSFHGKWVAFVDSRLYASTDKKTWKLQEAFFKEEDEEVKEGSSPDNIIDIRRDMKWLKFEQGKAFSSQDGVVWSEAKQVSRSYWWRLGVAVLAVFKEHLVAINFLGTTYVSSNGETWVKGDGSSRPGSVAENDEVMVNISWYDGVYVSDEPGKWQKITSEIVEERASQYPGDIVWSNNRFVIPQEDGILHSKNGVEWEKEYLNQRFPIKTKYGIVTKQNSAWGGNVLVAGGLSGTVYATACHIDPTIATVPDEILQTQALQTEETILDTAFDNPVSSIGWRGMEFVYVPAGCFIRRVINTENSPISASEQPICVKDFWLSKYEVTKQQWYDIMNSDPVHFKTAGDIPVERVSFQDIQQFLDKVNHSKHLLRLPTEAEWEYACRSGGKNELYSGGETSQQFAWFAGNSGGSPHAIGRKAPNGLGIFDMSGNVEEWVADSFEPDLKQDEHVIRGGAWNYQEKFINCSRRGFGKKESRVNNLGFRLVMYKK